MVNTSCAVFRCSSKSHRCKEIKFHQFPKDRAHLWIKACKRPDLLDKDVEQLRHMHICSLHFEPRMYAKQLLKKSAVPTLNLPTTCTSTVPTQTEKWILEEHQLSTLQIFTSQGVQTDPMEDSIMVSSSAANKSRRNSKREYLSNNMNDDNTDPTCYDLDEQILKKNEIYRASHEITKEHFLELCDVFLPYSLSTFVKESLC